ncbi:hypothetical protein [Pantoea sp. BAV 3049]|uniref:hypothetical protein n=1 Tax=Pantoea sp. BAV 3049 TaxID=2654188 RepID=UPI0018EECBC6|nr:hypothetical protein [Pantoea sp. BAV 3049]
MKNLAFVLALAFSSAALSGCAWQNDDLHSAPPAPPSGQQPPGAPGGSGPVGQPQAGG